MEKYEKRIMKKKTTTTKKTKVTKIKTLDRELSIKKYHGGGRRRGLWKGSIAFGLVNIPIILESAKQEDKIHFRMLDKRDNSPVGYRQINKNTQEEINRSDIIKGYEYKKGEYVLMSDADFKHANPKATSTIDIEDFVDIAEVDPMLYDKPYYVVPQKGGEKGYVLLREVLERKQKAAVAKVILHTVQHLALLMAREDYIVLELLRFADEIKEVHEADFLEDSTKQTKVSDREISVASQLVEGMSSEWSPQKYRNTYRDDLMKLIKNKIKRGTTAAIEEVKLAETDSDSQTNVIDLTALLKKSLGQASKGKDSKKRKGEQRESV